MKKTTCKQMISVYIEHKDNVGSSNISSERQLGKLQNLPHPLNFETETLGSTIFTKLPNDLLKMTNCEA